MLVLLSLFNKRILKQNVDLHYEICLDLAQRKYLNRDFLLSQDVNVLLYFTS